MPRYFCVFYSVDDKKDINKTNKIVKILNCENCNTVITKIQQEFNCKRIKYIRDLDNPRPYLYNTELISIEIENNDKLKKHD